MRRPHIIPDPTNADQIIHQAAFVLSFNSLVCLRISAVVVLFSSMTYLPISSDNMMYQSRLNNSKVHMGAVKDKNNNDINEPPKLSRNIPIE